MTKIITKVVDMNNYLGFNSIQAATKTASTGDKTMNQKFALIAITIGLLIAGWMDGHDHQMAQKYAASQQGQKLACIHCAGQP